jgi:hypothetical protein
LGKPPREARTASIQVEGLQQSHTTPANSDESFAAAPWMQNAGTLPTITTTRRRKFLKNEESSRASTTPQLHLSGAIRRRWTTAPDWLTGVLRWPSPVGSRGRGVDAELVRARRSRSGTPRRQPDRGGKRRRGRNGSAPRRPESDTTVVTRGRRRGAEA